MGIYDFEKVSEKFDEERMIVKAICINIESRDNFLKCSLENKTISLTLDEDSFQIYIEANIQPIIQCSKCGQYNHHKNDCPQNNTQICANCGRQNKSCSENSELCEYKKFCINCKNAKEMRSIQDLEKKSKYKRNQLLTRS